MDLKKCSSFKEAPSLTIASNRENTRPRFEECEWGSDQAVTEDFDIDHREIYFLIMHYLSSGPCRRTFEQFHEELLDHHLLPRRYHAWYSRSGVLSGLENDDGISFPSSYSSLVERYPHINGDHLVKLLKQLMLNAASMSANLRGIGAPTAASAPTLLGTGSFSLLGLDRKEVSEQVKAPPTYLRWPHMLADQVRGLSLREIGGGFRKHHRAPSLHMACYTIAKPSTMFQKMENIKKIRGHRSAVYCAIFDRSGRYVITGSDDRLVKIWSMETAFCLASCRGHEGDITDLAVSSNNALVASASNDFSIRVWRLPDGYPISVLRGHVGAVTAIAFSPRHSSVYQLLSSSDDGTCRIWDARSSDCRPRVYLPKPIDGMSTGSSSSKNGTPAHQILCCSYNANGTIFVTGSSDTFARVWSACKSNTNDPEQPNHEIDLLAGHENDVNYVQFSGCAVAPRSSTLDPFPEDNKQRFRNSWFNHDNIVTCSRDGSAIIWVQKSRKSHGKAGRWSRSYHLKVPPPPMLLQPPRGGPRQRFLPTPRGVNMIMWSLDNRFVLAAIMDCRICVWNASDGSLLHSLTGHTQSTYVLDVHPFNPRIAMSAGYDGLTYIWDIWEGLPIKTYNIGHHKLVDGKFSQDGTSIVLSDDVGQIYLLNTGQGESQKDAKYDQFFLGDYRPLIQDTLGNVVDQETQLPPYRRNIQDALCDGSMMPYPEPYQSMYQRRRLGALGIEWRPSTIKFAIGTDIGLGPELLPLADLDAVIEPLPEFIDAIYWDFDNEVVNDDTDSEYDIAEDFSSEGERKKSLPSCSPSDSDCQTEGDTVEEDGLRRSKRRKDKLEVKFSGRRLKRGNLDESGGSSSRTRRAKKQKKGRAPSKRKSVKEKSLRPQRAAARNALTSFSQIQEVSSDEDDESLEDDDSSESEAMLQTSEVESEELNSNSLGEKSKDPKAEPISSHASEKIGQQPKRLVLKFSTRNNKKSEALESVQPLIENQADLISIPASPLQETLKRVGSEFICNASSSANAIAMGVGISGNSKMESSNQEPIKVEESKETKNILGTMQINSEDHNVEDGSDFKYFSKGEARFRSLNQNDECMPLDEVYMHRGLTETLSLDTISTSQKIEIDDDDGIKSSLSDECRNDLVVSAKLADELKENSPLKPTKLRIKSKSKLNDLESSSQLKAITPHDVPARDGDEIMATRPPFIEDGNVASSMWRSPDSNRKTSDAQRIKFKIKTSKNKIEGFREDQGEGTSKVTGTNHDLELDTPETASFSGMQRTRSRLKSTHREIESENKNLRPRPNLNLEGTSDIWTCSSRPTTRSRSTRNRESLYSNDHLPDTAPDWLLLPRQDDCYRYIPQLGDEVVYLRQGHQEYLESIRDLNSGPWLSFKGQIRAVEFCSVESLKYSTLRGSGESCCKLVLKFIDPSSSMSGRVFRLTLSELNNIADFVVERTRYEASILRNWTYRDKCWVWWRDDIGQGGNWWEGRIISSKDKSNEFPGSPWERYSVRYKSDLTNNHLHSPWELHDLESPWEPLHIENEIRDELLSCFGSLTHSVRNQERYGISRLNQIALRSDFQNRFAVPLSPGLIELRLKNSYYRSLVAVKHDINVMLSNAKSYFEKNAEVTDQIRRLSDHFTKTFTYLDEYD